jgi:eukaryotic-like serine/threonine-protein kinase
MVDPLQRLTAALADRYRIERELDRGGMAIVYLAEDLKLGRRVAIKVLLPQISATLGPDRFLREIQVSARLSHPAILSLHDSGEVDGVLYYVMPYVEGESLQRRLVREGQLPAGETVRIVREVAEALTHAHRKGVIHRDVKPGNIMLSAGHALVSDFGIARVVEGAGGERLTSTGLAVGTPSYMSPEQAVADQAVDGRTDVYALACVAYEMLAGAPPFTGPTPRAVMARHAVDPMPPLSTVRPGVPPRVDLVLGRGLAKAPADRYATPLEFAVALEQAMMEVDAATGASVPDPSRPRGLGRHRGIMIAAGLVLAGLAGWPWMHRAKSLRVASLAVLPFDNLSGDQGEGYLVEGMHDALIGALGQIGNLRVTWRASSNGFRGSRKPLGEIARELGVDRLVTAGVLRTGDSVQFQVRLVQTRPEERIVWARAYSRELRDVLAMQGEAAQSIAREVGVRPTAEQEGRLAASRPVDPATYEAYLRGMYHLNRSTPEDIAEGLRYLQQAVDRNPGDALAWAGLALGYATVGHGPAPPPDVWQRARAAALRAVTLDPQLAEAHAALADVKLYFEWDWAGAEAAFRRANELNPSLAMNHYHYAWYLALFGRLDEAVVEHRRAQALDPLTPIHTGWLGGLYVLQGRPDAAIEEARKCLELDDRFAIGLVVTGMAYVQKGMFPEAIDALRRAVEVNPAWSYMLGVTLASAGQRDEARPIVAALENGPVSAWTAFGLGALHAALGDRDKAFQWLGREPHHAWLPWVRVLPEFQSLHGDPRFAALLEKMHLPA